MNLKIALDMDGVITDFIGSCNKLLDFDIIPYQVKYGSDALWQYINKFGLKFWTEMDWTDDGHMLWQFVNKHFKSVTIVTAVPAYKLSRYPKRGKNIWIDANIGTTTKRYIGRRKDKLNLLDSNTILIDDYAKTVDEWRANGGKAILHKTTYKTIAALQKFV